MSFPNVIYGRYGDEKVAQSTKIGNLPSGTKMILPDGREFAHAKQGGTAGVQGKVYVQEASVAGHGNVAASALVVAADAAIGATSVTLTVGATGAVTLNQYADGYMFTTAGTVGMGYMYKVKSNAAAGTTESCAFVLEPTDPIKEALVASSSLVSLRTAPTQGLVLKAAGSTFVGAIAGILPTAASANFYCWVQKKGIATVLNAATAQSLGNPVCCSSTDAGAVSTLLAAATTLYDHVTIGQHINAVDASKYGDIMLNIP